MHSLRVALLLVSTVVSSAPPEPPGWAFPTPPAGKKPVPDDGKPRTVPGSRVSLTVTQTRDFFAPPDWHPEEHVPMPPIVGQGRKPDTYACAFCHRATGQGGPENANISGLPADYIVRQVKAYRAGARTAALPERLPQKLMISISKTLTDEEIEASAAYFAASKPLRNLRVVESETAPKVDVVNWTWVAAKSGEREPLAGRIVEVPENTEQFELRDTRATFVAYVPVGSLARGEALVTGKVPAVVPVACSSCHGEGLKGLTTAPPIAGRSAAYAMRQLYAFKVGARADGNAVLMKPMVEKLSMDDLTAVVAYLSSLPP